VKSTPCLFLALVLAACGGDDAPALDAAPEPDAEAELISLSGTISEWLSPTTTNGVIEGAEVCVFGGTQCDTTDANGIYTLPDAVPANAPFGIAITADGYLRTVLLSQPQPDDVSPNMSMVTDAVAQQKVADAGGTWPLDTTGIVEFQIYIYDGNFTPAAGLTATMSPSSGTGAVYLGADGYPDTSLTSTSSLGATMFVNVTPGEVTYTPTLAGHDCIRAQDGWSGDTAGTLALRAEAATLIYVQGVCTPR